MSKSVLSVSRLCYWLAYEDVRNPSLLPSGPNRSHSLVHILFLSSLALLHPPFFISFTRGSTSECVMRVF